MIRQKMSDLAGARKSIYTTLGASNHTDKERECNDYYATEPWAIDVLHGVEKFDGAIWEPACGGGHLSKRLQELGYKVFSTDLIDRGYGKSDIDFLNQKQCLPCVRHIITNPPYKYALEFCQHAYDLVPDGGKVAMFLRLQFLEGKKRKVFFTKYPPKALYVSSSRIQTAKNGEFERMKDGGGSAVAYGWFVWEKRLQGDTVIKWVN